MARLEFFSGTAPDCLQVTFAFNDGRIILVGPNLGGLAEIVNRYRLELADQFFGDDSAASQYGDVL